MAQSVSEGSDLPNPLADYYSLPFFSRSLNLPSSTPSTLRNNPNPSFSDSLRAHLKARVLSSPDKILEQGTTILEGNVELLKADRSQAVSKENEKVPRERRPGLGLRRAKFSMKPMPSSQPEVSLDFSVDFSKLSDPDEYFDAFERMERAKKEVQRLKGEPTAKLDLNNVSLAPKRRRPSLLGRSATYTHRTYPSVSMAKVGETLLPSQETFLPSQETFDDDIVGPARLDVVPDANVISNSSTNRVFDSKATTTSKASELDELLSLNYEGLDDEGVQNLLREKLQIKSVDIGDFSFPEWRVPLCEPMNTSTTLSMRNDILKHLNESKIAVRGKATKSPAKSRSPLASISLLNRHIEERIPSKDLFSFDSSPEKATNPTGELKRADQAVQSNENDAMRSMHDERRSPVHEQEDTAATGEDSLVDLETDVVQISEPVEKEVVVGQSDQICNRTELHENERSVVHGEENVFGCDVGPTSEPETQNKVDAARESARQQLIFEALDTENSSLNGVEKGGMAEPSNAENIRVEEFTQETVGSSDKKLEKKKEKSKAPSKSAVSKKPVKRGKQAETSQVDVPVAKETTSKRRKVEVAGPGRSKENRRHSLYNAGTKWDGGLRRSTRNRMRPLEFWKGERLLYGRVHESLVTVIGVKYGTKVESFVSDEYKDLVEWASH